MKQWLKVLAGIVAVIIVTVSTLLMVMDSVAILFTYLSLPFALLSLPITSKNKKLLQLYFFVFLLAHLTMGWRAYTDSINSAKLHTQLYPKENINPFEQMIE